MTAVFAGSSVSNIASFQRIAYTAIDYNSDLKSHPDREVTVAIFLQELWLLIEYKWLFSGRVVNKKLTSFGCSTEITEADTSDKRAINRYLFFPR